jgi:hypothetical protein
VEASKYKYLRLWVREAGIRPGKNMLERMPNQEEFGC